MSDVENKLGSSRKAISLLIKKKFGYDFEELITRLRMTELKRLQGLMENEDVSVNVLCRQAGFKSALHYNKVAKERKVRKMQQNKKKTVVKKTENDIADDRDIKKKPEIIMRE